MKSKIIILVIALTLIASVGIMLYLVKIRGVAHAVNVSRDEYPILGVDLSSHNGDIDFNRLKADSVDFVMLKATEGTTFKDPKFNRNYTEARKAGISHIGAYHFFRFDTDGEMQAMNLINSLRGKTIDLPVAIDREEWTNPKHLDTDEVVTRLQAMIDYLEINGLTILFYTNKDGYQRFIRDRFDDYPLWICSFTDPPLGDDNNDWALWQYSHWGWTDACDTEVDLNTFNGDREQWLQWVKSSTF